MTRPVNPEQVLIRRTARRITLQTAALFTICLLLLAGLAGVFILRAQNADGQHQLRAAVADDDAVTDPPSGIVIFQSDDGHVKASPQLHGRPLDPGAFAAVQAGAPTIIGRATVHGREYQVRTARRDGDVIVQAGLDLTNQNHERDRLIVALLIASMIGLIVALAIGTYIARRAVRPLELASERQRRFVADASHELRTPLTQAHTRAQLLQRALAASGSQPELEQEAGRMVRSTRQLADIIDELLLSAQLNADPASIVPVDLDTLVSEVIEAETARAHTRAITVKLVTDGAAHIVPGSPTALRRVLNSLIDNAFGHVRQEGHITVSIQRGGTDHATVVCAVSDDGTGFAAGDANKIFERFARGDHGDARRFGLGLALVREVIQTHNGTIDAQATPGKGATFTIVLPAADD